MTEEPLAEVRTFLIADIRDYTRFTRDRGDEAAARLVAKFAAIAREGVEARRGTVVELRGDEVLAAFPSPRQALRAAVALQARFRQETEAEPDLPLGVGIGLDVGEAVLFEGGYRGGAVNLAARLCSLARPGEILGTEAVVHLAGTIEGLEYAERGSVQLKGFEEPIRVIEVGPSPPGQSRPRRDRPTPRAEERGRHVRAVEVLPSPAHGRGVGGEGTLPTGVFLGALPPGPLVAREVEMARFRRSVAAVAQGSGRAIVLAGEPGVGKTRLAQEVSLEARSRGFQLATASCYEQRQAVPFYPFLDVLATLYDLSPSALQAEIAQRWPHLGRLLPDRNIAAPAATADGMEEEERLFRAVTQFLIAFAGATPLALMLDDLHWSDESSIQLFHYLARHTRAHRVLLLGSYRDLEIGPQHPLQSALLDLNRQELVDWITIRRLEPAGTNGLVQITLGELDAPAEFAQILHRQTEGNPFYVQEVLRELVERGAIYRQDGQWVARPSTEIAVPERVRAVIEQRLSRLTGQTQEILREASVLGQRFRFDDLQDLSARDEEEVERALEEAMAAGLLRAAGKEEYSFNHALTRQALYDNLPPRRRRRLHLAAGEALERSVARAAARAAQWGVGSARAADGGEERVAELAGHFLEAGDAERAFPYAVLAGDRAEAIFAHREAERLYRAALDVVWETGASIDPPLIAQTLEKLGRVLQTMGRYAEALDSLELAAQGYRTAGDLEGERRTVARIGLTYSSQGRALDGIERLEPFVEMLEEEDPQPSSGLAMLYVALAHLYHVSHRYGEGLAAAERASQLAREIGDDRILAQAEVRRGEGLVLSGRYDEGRQVLESVVPLAESADLDTLVRALRGVAAVSERAGRFEESKTYHERALELAERLGDPRSIAISLFSLGETAYLMGDWERARALLQRAEQVIQPLSVTHLADQMQLFLAYLLLLQGDWASASGILEKGTLDREKDPGTNRLLNQILAERDLLEGHAEEAAARLQPLLADPGPVSAHVAGQLLLMARVEIERGRLDDAEHLALDAIARATEGHDRPTFAEALLIRGMVRARQGRREEAERLFESALSVARSMSFPFVEACILYEQGIMLQAGGEKAGEERLREALALFTRLGAHPFVERTQRALLAARTA